MNDKQQIEKAQQDMQEFAPLYDKYYVRVFRFVLSRVADAETCADITSDTFLKAMGNLKNFKVGDKAFLSWLMVIASNEIKMMYRKQKSQRNYLVSQEYLFQLEHEISEEETDRPLCKKLTTLLEALPENDYQLIHLRYFDNLSFKEIATLTQKSEQSLRVKTHRIKESLKSKLIGHAETISLLLTAMLAFSITLF
ncbi:MAG: sigma-70 family RNA polymerase sigma factor [Bacteroidales bacterium]|nr:sigma-70 family RNA polymerase sigma factor [Bacteroidales bacterium]MCF8459070.1 sigma-70 family RNA polymerase sigma factor [Bacteroidales bacterium]